MFFKDLNSNSVNESQSKLIELYIDLALRNDDYHIGSKLGGNNFQFLVLLNLNHSLSFETEHALSYKSHLRTMVWGAQWLKQSSVADIRFKLNEVFLSIPATEKYFSLMLESNLDNNLLFELIKKDKDNFADIINFINGEHVNKLLSKIDELIISIIICKNLANQLDSGDKSKIERIIIHNLDDDINFGKILFEINNLVGVINV